MPTDTPTSIHGHDVLHLLLDAPALYTRATLKTEITRRFGPGARFHTCSVQDFSFDQLLTFLIAKNKIIESPEGHLLAQRQNMCSGGEHDHHHEH